MWKKGALPRPWGKSAEGGSKALWRRRTNDTGKRKLLSCFGALALFPAAVCRLGRGGGVQGLKEGNARR